jgi:ABC-type cobalamin/Fe3+-siderophores transport system ATPase subunit
MQEIEDGVTDIAITDISPGEEVAKSKASKWTQLHSVGIKNFKAIKKTEINLGNVTILVGPNGSGKSSVLQAIHWAARASSYVAPKNTKEVVAFERLDYLPSSQPLLSSHLVPLLSATNSPPTEVAFVQALGEDGDRDTAEIEERPTTTVKIWAARNQGGVSVHISGGSTVTAFKQREAPITAYIPGLAGLSEKETILAKPLLRRQAASGDAGGVLRNVLFNLASRQLGETDNSQASYRVRRLNELIQSVHSGLSVAVGYDDREDVHINATFSDNLSPQLPLEAAATGVLQVIQIFAYLILFRPRILLVDEPDAHLHPDKQERLIEALESVAAEFNTQIVLTTHSQHIVRAASSTAKLIWMNNGDVVSDDHGPIRQLMGWGALDKKVLMFVEDEDDAGIRALLRQWPELYRQLVICRCFGVENLPKNRLLDGLLEVGNLNLKAVLHRDRDFMTDTECAEWCASYQSPHIHPWHTQNVDVEAYFCDGQYLQALYGIDADTADAWRLEAASKVKKAKEKFSDKRGEINRLLYSMTAGGQPATEVLWVKAGGLGPDTVVGKALLAQIKVIATAAGHDQNLLNNYHIPKDFILAPELKGVLEASLR